MSLPPHEEQWAQWMRAAVQEEDAGAYRLFLMSVRSHLWAKVRRRVAALSPRSDAEDIVQEVLFAIHLKRMSWDTDRPIGPWISAILRHKLSDASRWRRRQFTAMSIDVAVDSLETRDSPDGLEQLDLDRLLARLKERPRNIVQSMLVGSSVRETADRLGMTETAVRVTLHRARKRLAALYPN